MEIRDRAIAISRQAIEADTAQDYERAAALYQQAITYFISAIKCKFFLLLSLLLTISSKPHVTFFYFFNLLSFQFYCFLFISVSFVVCVIFIIVCFITRRKESYHQGVNDGQDKGVPCQSREDQGDAR